MQVFIYRLAKKDARRGSVFRVSSKNYLTDLYGPPEADLDGGPWGLPGGPLASPSDVGSAAARREFECVTTARMEVESVAQFGRVAEQVWTSGKLLYRGYLDDARNTDNAWVETCIAWFHSGAQQEAVLAAGRAPDDAEPTRRMWTDFPELCAALEAKASHLHVYPPHAALLLERRDAWMAGGD